MGIILVSLCLIIIGYFLLISKNFNTALDRLSLLPKQQSFTELYFQDPNNLPQSYQPGIPLSFSFSLHNEENRETQTPFTVIVTNHTGTKIVDLSTAVLKPNQSQSFTEQITINALATRSAVSVNLPDKNQSIHFWVD